MISNEDIQARKLDIALNRGALESSGSGLSNAHPSLIVSTTNFTDRPFNEMSCLRYLYYGILLLKYFQNKSYAFC